MPVGRQCVAEVEFAHDHKRCAVGEGKCMLLEPLEECPRLLETDFINRDAVDCDALVECLEKPSNQVGLPPCNQQIAGFSDDPIRRDERTICRCEKFHNAGVSGIIAVQPRKEAARIKKHGQGRHKATDQSPRWSFLPLAPRTDETCGLGPLRE